MELGRNHYTIQLFLVRTYHIGVTCKHYELKRFRVAGELVKLFDKSTYDIELTCI